MSYLKKWIKRCIPIKLVILLRSLYRRRPGYHEWYEDSQRYEFLRKAFITLKFNGISGDYAEFGCNQANTFRMAYRIHSKYSYAVGPFHMWAFDSFQGLPKASDDKDVHPIWVEGTLTTSLETFHNICQKSGIPHNAYTAVPGFYEETLASSASGTRPKKIRLAYIDCDMYTSTKDVLQFLMPRLQHGMILAFDDYYCYSDTMPSGERLAAADFFEDNPSWRLLPYVQFGWHGMSFIVEAIPENRAAGNGNHHSHW